MDEQPPERESSGDPPPPVTDRAGGASPPGPDLAETAAYDAAALAGAAAAASPDPTGPSEAPVETSSSVATEPIEAPVVRLAPPPEPAGSRRVGSRLAIVVGALAIVAIGGVAAFGYSLNQDLAATRSTLASTETDLETTTSDLETTTSDLEKTSTELEAATAERADLDATIAELSAEVAGRTECVTLQTAALEELARISDLQTDNFNRTAEDSTWAKSSDKRAKAVSDALDAYYQAYSKAFDGAISSARDWAAKGKAAVGVIATQATQQAAELALIDRSAAEIQAAIDALESHLGRVEASCREVTP